MKFPHDDLLPDLSALRSLRAAFVRQRRWVIGSTLIIAGVTAAAYAMAPRIYVASGTVSLDNRIARSQSAPGDGVRARNTELRVLTSGDLAGQVTDTLGLAQVRGIGQPDDGTTSPHAEARSRAIRKLIDGLETETTGASHAVAVRFAADNPALAARIVNRTLERYVAFRRGGEVPERDPSQLRDAIDRARDGVIRAETAVSAFRSAAAMPGTRGAAARVRRDIAGIDARLQDAVRDQAAAARRLWIVRSTGMRRGNSAAEEAQLSADRAALVQRLGSVHPDVAAIDSRLAELARGRRREVAATASLTEEVRAARARVGDLRAARRQASAELEEIQKSGGRLGELRKEAEAARNRYAALLAQQQQAEAAQLAARSGPFIIARAAVPASPASPRGWVYALRGLALALAAAVAIVLGGELLARGFRNRGHAERKLGIPVIGMVPDLNRLPATGGAKAARVDPADYLFFDSRSPFTAAFRSIHTGLRLGTAALSPRSVAVSSALPDEGKTTVSICLARSAALAGLRVLLIDCDVRHPAATRALAAHVSAGLIEVLRGEAEPKDALLRDTPSGAWILGHTITGGEGSDDLIGSPAMQDLIASLTHEFDLIVLDTPPALALDEARGVAAMADCVLLVARWHKTPVEATRIALEQLTRAGANVIAAALTLVGR
ncbi:MAG: hypothetical protein JWL91_645 [Sphingomonas bacterium]|nr:polysaccharide biosynthesis tyrosine autokinase [Sphingomonas bacterium]MDB5688769.1 hypothetical protein [Sphingomonas bacterium]